MTKAGPLLHPEPTTAPPAPDEAIAHRLLKLATTRLLRMHPSLSAARPAAVWQLPLLAMVVMTFLCATLVWPLETRTAMQFVCGLPFLVMSCWRLAAVAPPRWAPMPDTVPDRMPTYSVLVPLRNEANVLPGLIAALDRLVYPRDRLEILLLLESDDGETRRAAAAMALPSSFRVVVVPDGAPRTKPKALAYALYVARGELVTIYDAEDTPEPLQLIEAAAALMRDQKLACVQARLAIDPAATGWLARQYAIEYGGLFDGLLPALARFGAPLPLGGTSNHFRREALETMAGWDPFNVTEDADIGMRLHRHGLTAAVIASRTVEEPVARLGAWIRQRTRWMKGWMQTWSVHMRHPGLLVRQTGVAGFVQFQIILAVPLLAGLLHPVFLGMLVWDAATGTLMTDPGHLAGQAARAITAFNVTAGYLAAIGLTALLARRSGCRVRMTDVAGIPVYWLMISIATWRAVLQLVLDPHLWEKTPHAPRPEPRAGGNVP